MESHGLGEVDVGERVATDDDERVVQQTGGILDAARGAQGAILYHVVQVHPQIGPITEVVADAGPQVLQSDDHLGDPVATQQPEHVLHAGSPHHRNQRLGAPAGEGAQAATLTSGHHDRLHPSIS